MKKCRCGVEFPDDGLLWFGRAQCGDCDAKDQAEKRESERVRMVARLRKSSGLPLRMVRYLTANPGHPAHDWAAQALARIKAEEDLGGFYLHGAVGTGKTVRAVALALASIDSGMSALYVSESMLVHGLRRAIRTRDNDDGAADIIDRAIGAHLTIIDDIGTVESRTEFVADTIGTIVLARFDAMRPTVLTSNDAPGSLAKLQTPAFARRVIDHFECSN